MFKKIKKNSTDVSEKHFKEAINYENDKNIIIKKSNKIAWLIAFVFMGFSAISWIGLYLMLPLKEVTPYVIRVDSATGIPDIITGIDETTLSANEALDKYFLNHYVQLRENYTYQTIQKTYELTQLFSSPSVSEEFRTEYNQADSLDNILGTGTAIVKVISISLDKIHENNLANIRFQVTLTDSRNIKTVKNYIARVSYRYNPQQKLSLAYRIENPIGFQVTSYQKHEENL